MKVEFKDLVKIYGDEISYTTDICGLKRELPIRQVDEGVWIASNHSLVLGRDIPFTERASEELSNRIKDFYPDYLITAESKSLPLVYKISKKRGLQEMIVARKGIKAYMGSSYLMVQAKSITTAEPQKLVLEHDQAKKMKGKKVAIVDDVVSTGGTLVGLEELVEKAGGTVVCKAAVWLEGPWYANRDIIFLSILPVFVNEKKYTELLEKWENRNDKQS